MKKVVIFCSSNPISVPELQVEKLINFWSGKGYEVNILSHCYDKLKLDSDFFRKKADEIHAAVQDKNVEIMQSFWGGYNTNELLNYLDFDLIRNNPKFWIGFSDTSALLQAITQKTGIITYMGPAGISFCKPKQWEYNWKYLKKCLYKIPFEVKKSSEWSDDMYFLRDDQSYMIIEKNADWNILNHNIAKGRIVASHLGTMLDLFGTEFFPELKNKILCIEFAEDESESMIFHRLVQAFQIGVFDDISGLLIGRFHRNSGVNVEKMLVKFFTQIKTKLKKMSVIISNLDFGHTDPIITLPNGGICVINHISNKNYSIHIEQ